MRKKIFNYLVRAAMEKRKFVLISTAIITLFFAYTTSFIKIDMRWSALLPENNPTVKEFTKIDKNYLQPGNMIVVISGEDDNMLEIISDETEQLLKEQLLCSPEMTSADIKKSQRYAKYIYGKMPLKWMTENMLALAKPATVKRLSEMYSEQSLLGFLKNLNNDFEKEYTDSEAVKNQEREVVAVLDGIEKFIINLNKNVSHKNPKIDLKKNIRDLTIGRPYSFSLDNKMTLIMIASAIPTEDFQFMPLLDKKIEQILEPLVKKYPAYKIERTGMVAIGRDEMDSIGPYTQLISLIAITLIFILLVWFFRSKLMPFIALTPIIIGIIWTTGIIGLTIGEMNILTIMIMVVLLGLGIDFTIHLSSRFNEEILAGQDIPRALYLSVSKTGIGVITGAVTTAVAFFALMIAKTKGISQFGFCAGTGIISTLLAVFWILPFMLAASMEKRRHKNQLPEVKHNFNFLEKLVLLMGRKRKLVAVIILLLTIAGFWAGSKVEWEYNFMNLEPKGLRSIELQDEIIERYKISTTASFLTVGDIESSRKMANKFKKKRAVGEVSDVSAWVSRKDFPKNLPHIKKIQQAAQKALAPTLFKDRNSKEQFAKEMDRLWANIVEIQSLSFTGGQDKIVEKTRRIVETREKQKEGLLWQLKEKVAADQVNWQNLNKFSKVFSRELRSQLKKMTANVKKVTEKHVPVEIMAQFKSRTAEGYLLTIMPRYNLFEKGPMQRFKKTMEKIDHRVTGMPQMILSMSLETVKEGRLAVILSIFVILLVLLIDFRRPLIAFLTFLPLITSLALTTGLMYLIGEKFNYVNIIALPVIIGIGIDDGVHYFHRLFQEGPGGIRKTVHSVGQAMMMTSLTTMIGFGSLMIYLMRGMASMGRVLFFGVGFCFIITVTLLPALTVIFEKQIFKEISHGAHRAHGE